MAKRHLANVSFYLGTAAILSSVAAFIRLSLSLTEIPPSQILLSAVGFLGGVLAIFIASFHEERESETARPSPGDTPPVGGGLVASPSETQLAEMALLAWRIRARTDCAAQPSEAIRRDADRLQELLRGLGVELAGDGVAPPPAGAGNALPGSSSSDPRRPAERPPEIRVRGKLVQIATAPSQKR